MVCGQSLLTADSLAGRTARVVSMVVLCPLAARGELKLVYGLKDIPSTLSESI